MKLKPAILKLLVLCLILAPKLLSAEQRELKTDSSELIDVAIVLDSSGSMLLNDPLRLRDEGAKLLLQFLKLGDRVGIIEFSEAAKVVRDLESFDPILLEEMGKSVGQIETAGQYTDLLAGLTMAREILEKNRRNEAKPVIVLLSDGKMEPNHEHGTASDLTDRLLKTFLPEVKASGLKIYTLAFSEDADQELLRQIAAGTDGVSWFTPSVDRVHESFADLFLAVKKPQVISLGAKGFTIDESVEEATFYVSRPENQYVRLETPDGVLLTSENKAEGVRWFRGQKFEVITVKEPVVGRWKLLDFSSQEGFATLLTNLKLATDWPSYLDIGKSEVLQARLYEGDKPIEIPQMSEAVRYAFQIVATDKVAEPVVRDLLVDDGSQGDKISEDGIYSFTIKIDEPGEYKLRVLAKGPTFERQQHLPFRVRPPFLSLSISRGEHEEKAEDPHGEEKSEHSEHSHETKAESEELASFSVEISEEALSFKDLEVSLLAIDSSKTRFKIPLTRASKSAVLYEASEETLPHEGKFELYATMTGEERDGKHINEKSRTLTFTKVKRGEEPHVVAIVKEDPKEKPEEKGKGFPLIEAIIVTILNVGAGLFLLTMTKRSHGGGGGSKDVVEIAVPAEILEKISALEKKTGATEVDLNDPLFMDDKLPLSASGISSSAVTAPETKENASS